MKNNLAPEILNKIRTSAVKQPAREISPPPLPEFDPAKFEKGIQSIYLFIFPSLPIHLFDPAKFEKFHPSICQSIINVYNMLF